MKEWQQFVARLEEELGSAVVQEWLPRVVRFDAANLYLEARDSFQVSWFEEHVRPRLKGFVNCNQRPIKVHLEREKREVGKREEPRALQFLPDSLDPEMTLEAFVPSEKNLVAYRLLQEGGPFNPVYLFGPKGSGKTHLLMGVAELLRRQGKRVFYVRAERFTEHVVQAIRLGQMQAFRKVYREIDVLVVDDIHVFSRKAATQEEFFHTFNALHTIGKPIYLSANVAPMQLSEVEPRLMSRFEWGLSLGIERSDVGAILEKKAAQWKMAWSEELKGLFLERFPRDPVMALQALALRSKGQAVNRVVAERLLRDLMEKEEEKALTAERIVKAVAEHYGITAEDILGKSQVRECALPRQVAMYLCREKLKWPFQKIGELFKRDHSTVMSSVKQTQKAIEEKKIEAIEKIAPQT